MPKQLKDIAEMMKISKEFSEPWVEVKLGDICKQSRIHIEKGKPLIFNNILKGNVPVVAGGQSVPYYHNQYTHNFPCITVSASGAYAGYVWYHERPIWASDCNVLYGSISYDTKFLYFVLTDKQAEIYHLQTGGAQPHVYATDIKVIHIPDISFSEQKRIAEVLGCWDEGIEKLEKIITLKEQQKKGLMQRLLTGKTRLRGFSKPWIEVKLGDLGECIRGVTYKREADILEKEDSNTFRLLRSTNIQNNLITLDDIQILSFEKLSKKQILQKKDIVICMANGSIDLVGKSAEFSVDDKRQYSVGAFCSIFRINNTQKDIVKYLFQSTKYQQIIKLLTAGSSINNLRGSDIEGIKFTLPKDLVEQSAIASILSTADDEISQLKQKLFLFKQQKKWLMQQLLTGKNRLKIKKEN
jgi:type I restriction enzyme S subunit